MSEWRKENIATMAITAVLVLGLWSMDAGGHAFWGMVMLLNLNLPKSKST